MRLPILMYHQVTPYPDPRFRKYAVTPDALSSQIRWIRRHGFTPVRLDDIFGGRAVEMPSKPVAITFDDGFEDCVTHAVPVLEDQGCTATFFLVAGLMGQRSAWLVRERGFDLPLIDWATARSLTSAGFECGGHSLTHPRLAELSAGDCRRELLESRLRLEDGLGCEVRHLAYPFGSCNEAVRAAAADCGYLSACTVKPGIADAAEDPLMLLRIPVNGTDHPLAFTRHLAPAGVRWFRPRQAAAQWWRELRGEPAN